MRTIIAGSRSLGPVSVALALKQYKLPITKLICGCAEGVDQAGYYAMDENIPVSFFPAWAFQYKWAKDKEKFGDSIHYPLGGYSGSSSSHGFFRNRQMAKYAEAVILVWDLVSDGTKSMVKLAKKEGLYYVLFDGKGNLIERG